MTYKQYTLLTVGPVNMSARVRQSLSSVDFCHREDEFADLMIGILLKLENIYDGAKGKYKAVMITGSGSAGVEAMLGTVIDPARKALFVTNGTYGERMHEMARRAGKSIDIMRHDWKDPIDFAALEDRFKSDTDIHYVAAVHHETTTGRLNNVHRLLNLCAQYDKKLILDTVSSFGAEELAFDDKGTLLAFSASSNKCLHGAPGLAYALIHNDFWADNKSHAHSLYLDLLNSYRAQQKNGFSPFTQATHVAVAFDVAIDEFLEAGGWIARNELYKSRIKTMKNALADLDLKPYLEKDVYCSMFMSYYLPDGWSYSKLHDALKEHGFVIYAGAGDIASKLFRIGNMGDITQDEFERFYKILKEILNG